MTALYLLEPADPGRAWTPFAGVRPLCELRAGAWLIRERWTGVLRGLEVEAILGSHVDGFAEAGVPPVMPATPVEGPCLVAASWFAPAGNRVEIAPETRRLVNDGTTVAWVVPAGETWGGAEDLGGREQEIEGLVLHGSHDLVTALELLLPPDCADFLAEGGDPVPDGSIVIGDPLDVVLLGATVDPGVVFDTRQGPVVLEEGVQVRSGSRLEGPLYVGAGTILLGGAIRHSAIGPQCRVHGEVSTSVFLGYANKSHDGFLGHSVVGQWVNLGAGTITSNLKNTYGEVRLSLPGEQIPTARANLGTIFGDHVKTAIGTLLPTGCVIGAGANLFGDGMVPKFVPPMAWGLAGARMKAEEFLVTAGRVLPRRGVELTAELDAWLRSLHARLIR
jgi:UDP-N-acetylglucosamine diphosphorylase/glucosamine-1-phosphate N-acetyltransferase